MKKSALLGDEAIAQAAMDAGLTGIYAYPGTPSTEITEYVQKSKFSKENNIHTTWSANEKTAMESALGVSYTGKRAMVCMKHVGLNVAADGFINSAITGANGGLIVTVADDPSMHSSQNEQDSRYYGKFAMVPILEPSDQQQAYDMVHYGFDLSEKLGTPVLLRITTRLAHSRAAVGRKEQREQNHLRIPYDPVQYVLMPMIARRNYGCLIDKQPGMEDEARKSGYNEYFEGKDKSLGIIVCGLAHNYLMENYPDRDIPYPVLKIGQYPIPRDMVKRIYDECDEILVIEEGYPYVEEQIIGLLGVEKKIRGRLDGSLPRAGELNPNKVGIALGKESTRGKDIPNLVAPRPPKLCPGCGHIDSFNALNGALIEFTKGRVFADIGCYTLGALPPFNALNTCVDMGASITMAKGAADAGLVPAVAVIGDSTFTHSGMTGLLDAIIDNSPITVIIADNSTTAMTGGQFSPAHGRIKDICLGLGLEPEHFHILQPLKKYHEENVEIIKQELNYNGVSVIVPQRECVVTLTAKTKAKKKQKKTESVNQ